MGHTARAGSGLDGYLVFAPAAHDPLAHPGVIPSSPRLAFFRAHAWMTYAFRHCLRTFRLTRVSARPSSFM